MWSQIDLAHAFMQFEVDEASRDALRIITEDGLFRYTKLPERVAQFFVYFLISIIGKITEVLTRLRLKTYNGGPSNFPLVKQSVASVQNSRRKPQMTPPTEKFLHARTMRMPDMPSSPLIIQITKLCARAILPPPTL